MSPTLSACSTDAGLRRLQRDRLTSYRPPGVVHARSSSQSESSGSWFSKPRQTQLLRVLEFSDQAHRDAGWTALLRAADELGWARLTPPLLDERADALGRPCGSRTCTVLISSGFEDPAQLVLMFHVKDGVSRDRSDDVRRVRADRVMQVVLTGGRLLDSETLDPADATQEPFSRDVGVLERTFAFPSATARDQAVARAAEAVQRLGWRPGRDRDQPAAVVTRTFVREIGRVPCSFVLSYDVHWRPLVVTLAVFADAQSRA